MKVGLELEHDPSGRNTLAGARNVIVTPGDRSSLDDFEFKPEVFKPLPETAKALYFLELKGPEVITEDNTLDYLAKAAQGSGRYSFLSLLKNHVFAADSTIPLLAWEGRYSNYGLLAASKAKPRGNVLRIWDIPNVVGPEWGLVSGCWADAATLRDAVTAVGLPGDDQSVAMSILQLGLSSEGWPVQQ